MTLICLQPAPSTDHITADGAELTRLPYPFFVREDGMIERQDVWNGNPLRAVGFVADLARQDIDLAWEDAVEDPAQTVGMYLITENSSGGYATHTTAISEATVQPETKASAVG